MIISCSGRIGSGKDTVAAIIQKLTSIGYNTEDEFGRTATDIKGNSILEYKTPWEIKKFAYKLKQIASILTGIPQEKFEDQEFKKLEMGPEWNTPTDIPFFSIPMTYRTFLQFLGTDAIRDGLHINTWTNALFANYKIERYQYNSALAKYREPYWIITDTRFPNEYDAVKDRHGITIKINRGPYVDPTTLHESETALDGYEFDYVIDNNGTKAELETQVKAILKHLKII